MRYYYSTLLTIATALARSTQGDVLAAEGPHFEGDGHEHAAHDHAAEEEAHPTFGPHKGILLELGAEEFHAELVLDENKGTVTVFILDAAAKKEVPIDAPIITVNARPDGKPAQFKLAAVRSAQQPQGPTAQFASKDAQLMKVLHAEKAEPRLVARIGKKSYVAKIVHEHDDEHDHDHEEGDGHDHDHEDEAVRS